MLAAVRYYNKRHRKAEYAKMLGTFEDFMTADDLSEDARGGLMISN